MGKQSFKRNPNTSVVTTSETAAATAGILFSAFDDGVSADQFAIVTHGVDRQRLRIFNVRSGTVNNDYASENKEKFTSLTWGRIVHSDLIQNATAKSNKKAKKPTSKTIRVIALGTQSGNILFFSLAHGDIVHSLTGSHTMPVTDFVFNQDGTRGYSVSHDNYIVEWNLEDGTEITKWKTEVKNARKLKLSHDETKLAIASHRIHLYDVKTREVIKQYTGHASYVSHLAFSPKDDILVSSAEDDRYMNVWDSQTDNQNTNNLSSLTIESNVAHIAFSSTESAVLAVSEDGMVAIWQNAGGTSAGSSARGHSRRKMIRSLTRQPDSSVKIVSEEAEDAVIPILLAAFIPDNNGKSIMVARGSSVKPSFEAVRYTNEETHAVMSEVTLTRHSVTNFLLDDASIAANNLKLSRKAYDEMSVNVLGEGDFVIQKPALKEAEAESELTIEQKLQSMNVEEEEEEEEEDQEVEVTKQRVQNPTPGVPSAGSLQQALVQALHSNDRQLLEACLGHKKEVVYSTVQRLPANYVIPLLKQLIARFEEKPIRAPTLLMWIQAVLLLHTTYLMTVPDLVGKLGGFYQALNTRLTLFPKMQKLYGRLELVDSQIESRRRFMLADKQVEKANQPVNVYDEEDSDDEAAHAETSALQEEDMEELEGFTDEEDMEDDDESMEEGDDIFEGEDEDEDEEDDEDQEHEE
ncbi:WD40-repeat-containing domain protein [Radiomyces spectabilis]|uniref:WD40-repeat-containing domain protein n=1 Tax=Radiomyces spectabilis TaxID=64574 RepID=UPI00221F70F5|nr:WD40-repeat-containing domain protein [Radiomyces spectabilis]KAI8391193.1 WD40-repeat-containing domain protein [Radiomyces spectabilis]